MIMMDMSLCVFFIAVQIMAKAFAVQKKIPCVFVTGVQEEASSKRSNQPFKVTASDVLNPEIIPHDIDSARVTEKVDGTCCLIQEHEGNKPVDNDNELL
jgi:hypothetical protein